MRYQKHSFIFKKICSTVLGICFLCPVKHFFSVLPGWRRNSSKGRLPRLPATLRARGDKRIIFWTQPLKQLFRHLYGKGELLEHTYTGFHYVRRFPWRRDLDKVAKSFTYSYFQMHIGPRYIDPYSRLLAN